MSIGYDLLFTLINRYAVDQELLYFGSLKYLIIIHEYDELFGPSFDHRICSAKRIKKNTKYITTM